MRERPIEHIRKTRNKIVQVNKGVSRPGPNASHNAGPGGGGGGGTTYNRKRGRDGLSRMVRDLGGLDPNDPSRIIKYGVLVCELGPGKTIPAGTDLSSMNLRGADFSGMTIKGVRFSFAELKEARFDGAEVEDCEFSGTLANSSWAGAKVKSTEFGNSNNSIPLMYSTWENATIENCTFTRANAAETSFSGAKIIATQIIDSAFRSSVFEKAELSEVEITDSWVASSSFAGATINNTNFVSSNLNEVNWVGASFYNMEVSHPNKNAGKRIKVGFGGATRGTEPNDVTCKYEQHSFAETKEIPGVDADSFLVGAWSGDIEVRDNVTQKVITSNFDPKRHHIPPWAFQNVD